MMIPVPKSGVLEKVEGDAEVERAVVDALRARFDGEYVRFEAQMVVATAVKE